MFAIVAARDWVLPMYGTRRTFLAPHLDLLNFGQARALLRALLPIPSRSPPDLLPISPDPLSPPVPPAQVGVRMHFDDASHAFRAIATEPIKKGAEVLFFYGNFCARAALLPTRRLSHARSSRPRTPAPCWWVQLLN